MRGAQLLECEDVGFVVDLMRSVAMTHTVSWQEEDLVAVEFAADDRIGGCSSRGRYTLFVDDLEVFHRVQTAATYDCKFCHGCSVLYAIYRQYAWHGFKKPDADGRWSSSGCQWHNKG